jgi:hypothetical protein
MENVKEVDGKYIKEIIDNEDLRESIEETGFKKQFSLNLNLKTWIRLELLRKMPKYQEMSITKIILKAINELYKKEKRGGKIPHV